MPWISQEIISVLWFLLPGFVAAWVFLGLTRHPKLSEFEQIIQALIFTAFTQGVVIVVAWMALGIGRWRSLGAWTDEVKFVWSVVIAVVLGAFFAWLANHDQVHSWLRRRTLGGKKITKQSGYPSEWFRAFNERGETYITLHLKSGKKLRGWVEEWPVDPRTGHLNVQRIGWVDDAGTYRAWPSAKHVLVPVSEVSFVEFMDPELLKSENGAASREEQAP